DARFAVGRQRRLDWRVVPVEPLVALFLPPFGRHVLMEVALRVHEPDADQRHAEVARFLAVIACEDAEAARVDRQRLMQRELGGEIRDRLAGERRKRARPPRIPRRARIVERGDRAIVDLDERAFLGCLLQLVRRDQAQHADRVVRRGPPQGVVEPAEHGSRFRMPAPPEVDGEFFESMEAFREGEQSVSCHESQASTSDANLARSMLPPETTATILPAPALSPSAAAIAQPAAPSAMTCARSAACFIARATASSETTIDPDS